MIWDFDIKQFISLQIAIGMRYKMFQVGLIVVLFNFTIYVPRRYSEQPEVWVKNPDYEDCWLQ